MAPTFNKIQLKLYIDVLLSICSRVQIKPKSEMSVKKVSFHPTKYSNKNWMTCLNIYETHLIHCFGAQVQDT